MAWWTASCPVNERERTWIEESMAWFCDEFGEQVLHGDVLLPTDEFFPGAYQGSEQDVRRVLDLLCDHMHIRPRRVVLEFHDESDHARMLHTLDSYAATPTGVSTAGHYQRRRGRTVVSIESSLAEYPMGLVATVAHELCHELLIGQNRLDPDTRRDHEPLTDLLTVFVGAGIFSANAAYEFTPSASGWQSRGIGYLTEPMYGYALARYAWLRDEPRPAWAKHLDTNPRTTMKRGLRYLASARSA